MREILFRGKRIDDGEWVEGYVVQYPSSKTEIHKRCTEPPDVLLVCEVDPETVCQYTEMDDINGKEIYEGDICDREEKFPEIVTYHDGDWTLDYSYASGKEIGYNYCNLGFYAKERGGVEVIGNIFDNPELLKEDTENANPAN